MVVIIDWGLSLLLVVFWFAPLLFIKKKSLKPLKLRHVFGIYALVLFLYIATLGILDHIDYLIVPQFLKSYELINAYTNSIAKSMTIFLIVYPLTLFFPIKILFGRDFSVRPFILALITTILFSFLFWAASLYFIVGEIGQGFMNFS